MESPNFEFGHGPNSDYESDDLQHLPPGPPQITLPLVVHEIDSRLTLLDLYHQVQVRLQHNV